MQKLFLSALLCLSCATLRADFTYQETTQMTGGSLVSALRLLGPFARGSREPTVSTHLIKGNRMATVTKDRTTILDLDKESITTVDQGKKTYSVMTFAEMKQMMEDAQKKMQELKSQKQLPSNVQMTYKVSSKATGQTKIIQGLTAKEIVTTITQEVQGADQAAGQSAETTIVSTAWLATVPGYEEVKAFYQKMAVKMGNAFGSDMAQMSAQMGMVRADVGKGFEEAAKEMAKLDGVPVETVVKMSSAGGPSDGQPAQGQQQANSQQQSGSSVSPGGALGRLAGGLGGFGRNKKKAEEPPPPPPPADQQQGNTGSVSLMETTTQMNSFSSGSADASKFEVPAGFKQVQVRGLGQ
jgi:hypothetical protein